MKYFEILAAGICVLITEFHFTGSDRCPFH